MKAALWGTTVGYSEYRGTIIIETIDGRVIVINEDTFDHLYYRLNEFVAALKEDCIDYVIYSTDNPVCYYPDWFIDSVHQGFIFVTDDISTFSDEYTDVELSNGSVLLRNFKGQLMHMERNKFDKYFDTLEE